MQVFNKLEGVNVDSSAVAIGFFDGLHKGHASLIKQLVKTAKSKNIPAVVLTFAVHPRVSLNANYVPKLLTTNDERLVLLEKLGVDITLMVPFTAEMLQMGYKQFMRSVLVSKLNAKYLLVGYDHHFGSDRQNGFEQYAEYGKELGIEVEQGKLVKFKAMHISSSMVRTNLEFGRVGIAADLLGYNYFISGTVISGHKLGRTIGFPTANLAINDVHKQVPAEGVYAVRVQIEDEDVLRPAMLNIGVRPTFVDGGVSRSIEVHIFDFAGDLYHKKIKISFLAYVREEIKFESAERLAKQLFVDSDAVLQWFNDQV